MASGNKETDQRIMRISDIADEPCEFLTPISGYEDMPVVPLEIAVQPLIPLLPMVQSYAYAAKQRCKNPPADGLTLDESASIILYSMGWEPLDKCLYCALNATLRSAERSKLKPWFSYLKLFFTALARLPSNQQLVFRGVKLDLHKDYPKGKTVVWWGFSSCTVSIDILQSNTFLGKKGARTMFAIECSSGKDIQKHSYFPSEDEILLLPGTQFKVIGCLDQGSGLHTVQLQERQPPFPLRSPINVTASLPETTSNKAPSAHSHTRSASGSRASSKPVKGSFYSNDSEVDFCTATSLPVSQPKKDGPAKSQSSAAKSSASAFGSEGGFSTTGKPPASRSKLIKPTKSVYFLFEPEFDPLDWKKDYECIWK